MGMLWLVDCLKESQWLQLNWRISSSSTMPKQLAMMSWHGQQPLIWMHYQQLLVFIRVIQQYRTLWKKGGVMLKFYWKELKKK